MDILTFLNQPIVLTLTTLLIGSYLLSILSERRARKEKLREEAIKFLSEIGEDLNKLYSRLFAYARRGTPEIWKDQEIKTIRGHLFTKRMSVKMKSRVYLNSDELWRQYDSIIWEFTRIMEEILRMQKQNQPNETMHRVRQAIQKLAKEWPVESDSEIAHMMSGERPLELLTKWTEMVVLRADQMLANNLRKIFNE